MSHSIGIVAHTTRADEAHALQETVGAVYLSIDDGHLGCTRNHQRVWSWLAEHSDTDYLVVLEDDAQPIADFSNQLTKVLDAAPTPIVGLYLGAGYPPQWQSRIRQAIAQADINGASWITGELLFGVGVAIQTALVPDMLTHTAKTTQGFDFAIRDWAKARKHTIGFCYPSIVNHLDIPSIAKHPDGGTRDTPRKAHKVGTRGTWTKRTVTM